MRSLLIILSRAEHEAWAQELIVAGAPAQSLILIGTPAEAAHHLAQAQLSPSHIVFDIGNRDSSILSEIDTLAEQCEPGTRVIAVGDSNDILLYREIIARGVIDYLPMPAPIPAALNALTVATSPAAKATAPTVKPASPEDANKRVIVFMNAAAGDGASTAALNVAYAISELGRGRTVLVDMDYQYGMVAKQLGLQNQYGIRDLFDHPERGVDSTLIQRMVAVYGKLDVITAPAELRYLPPVSSESIRELITTLKQNYDTVILDVPHVWLPWVGAAIQQSTQLVLIAQLWLKSVSHASRLMRALRELNVPASRVMAIINRSGSKFKEAIEPKDFERVCNLPIAHTMVNDIKTIVTAEASATTILQLPPSELGENIQTIARALMGMSAPEATPAPKRSGLFSKR